MARQKNIKIGFYFMQQLVLPPNSLDFISRTPLNGGT